MKKTYTPHLVSGLLIFIYINISLLYAQEITGIELIPENPSYTDEILLVVHTAFPYSDCSLDSIHPYFACGAFSYDAFYNTGFDSDSCERSDTISIGVLNNGMYVISYRMYFLGWSQVDQADTFIVVGTTGIEHRLAGQDNTIRIWPNPSYGKVNIQSQGMSADMIRIERLSGGFSKEFKLDAITAIQQNEVYLQPGLYICTALKEKRILAVSKFIVLE